MSYLTVGGKAKTTVFSADTSKYKIYTTAEIFPSAGLPSTIDDDNQALMIELLKEIAESVGSASLNYQPIVAGGFLRDLVSGYKPKDIDVWVARSGGRQATKHTIMTMMANGWGKPKQAFAASKKGGMWNGTGIKFNKAPAPTSNNPLQHAMREVVKWELPSGLNVDIIFLSSASGYSYAQPSLFFDIRACQLQAMLHGDKLHFSASKEAVKDIKDKRLYIFPHRKTMRQSLARATALQTRWQDVYGDKWEIVKGK